MTVAASLTEFNLASAILLVLAASRWGAAPERLCVAVHCFMLFADAYYHALVGPGTIYYSVDPGHLAIDATAAIQFFAIALFANRMYPLWLAAFQIVSVIAHFARMELSEIGRLAYGLLNYGPYYLQIVTLAFGLLLHARRARRYSTYQSWRS